MDKKASRRRTVQRDLVLDAIVLGNHPTARTIYNEVSKYSSISFGTVYRNLQILVEDGAILQIETGASAHYDKKTEPHYHLHCKKCGGVFDIVLPYQQEFDLKAAELSGFHIDSHMILFDGLCSICAARK
ncbi:MAG: Fur family transcriptional regulator [Termitinemataceae bacterium]|nr:MAG: Fur family transcriptional regulator [Termitinemataceae bacterium]